MYEGERRQRRRRRRLIERSLEAPSRVARWRRVHIGPERVCDGIGQIVVDGSDGGEECK